MVSTDVAKDRHDPASFTDLDQDEIRDLNHGQDLSTLLGETMNAYSYSDSGNGYGYSYLRIRGFDQARIAVNVNGVPLNTPESHQAYTINLGDFATGLGLIQSLWAGVDRLLGDATPEGVMLKEGETFSAALQQRLRQPVGDLPFRQTHAHGSDHGRGRHTGRGGRRLRVPRQRLQCGHRRLP